MKCKLFLLVFALFSVSLVSYAQDDKQGDFYKKSYGAKVGLDFQTINGSIWSPTYNTGFVVGAFADYLKEKSGIRIEALLCKAHYTTVRSVAYDPAHSSVDLVVQRTKNKNFDSISNGDFNCLYFKLPLLLEFPAYRGLSFLIGPQYSQLLSIKDNNKAFSNDFSASVNNIFKSASVDVVFGFEAKVNQQALIGARFGMGLSDINNHQGFSRNYDGWKLWSFQFDFGFKIKGNNE